MKKGDNRLTEIFNYLRDYIDNNGYPPTVREIADEFNIKSTSTVHYYLEKLKNSGMIDNVAANKKRAISMTSTRTPANYVKLVGNVSAGTGILAVENVEGEFPLPKDIFGGDQLFMLRVEGESMIMPVSTMAIWLLCANKMTLILAKLSLSTGKKRQPSSALFPLVPTLFCTPKMTLWTISLSLLRTHHPS